AMLGHERVEAAEEYALTGPLRIERGADVAAVERGQVAAQRHAFSQQRLGWRRSSRRFARQTELVEPKQADVGPHPFFFLARREVHFQEPLPSPPPLVNKPAGLRAGG